MPSKRGRDLRTEAIVLKTRTVGEDDLWVDFLTPRQGRLHGIARHGRKSRKRFGGVLDPLNRIRVRYRDHGNLVALEEASLDTVAHHIDASLPKLSYGFHFLELIRQLVPERNADEKIYKLLRGAIEALDRKSESELRALTAEFEYRLLVLCGLKPQLTECLSCAKSRAENPREKFFFFYKEGGLYCADCLPPSAVSDIFTRESAPRVLSRFIEYQLGRPLKTQRFLDAFPS